MPPRRLTAFEGTIANAVVSLGISHDWEFGAYLITPVGPLIEIRCLMRDDSADPSQDVHSLANAGAQIVVHHVHLSQESLSIPDWNGLVTLFSETFAHCADGTRYWGRVVDRAWVEKIVHCDAQRVEMNAQNHLFSILNGTTFNSIGANAAQFFRKEVVNRAMRLRGFVEYEYSWGSKAVPPHVRQGYPAPPSSAGILGTSLEVHIDQAASLLAPTL
jgi:hypothetical protein